MKIAMLGALVVGLATVSSASADVALTWQDSSLDVQFTESEATLVLQTKENVSKIVDDYVNRRNLHIRMMKSFGNVRGLSGAIVVELVSDVDRFLVVQRLYEGSLTVLKVQSNQVPMVLREY